MLYEERLQVCARVLLKASRAALGLGVGCIRPEGTAEFGRGCQPTVEDRISQG